MKGDLTAFQKAKLLRFSIFPNERKFGYEGGNDHGGREHDQPRGYVPAEWREKALPSRRHGSPFCRPPGQFSTLPIFPL